MKMKNNILIAVLSIFIILGLISCQNPTIVKKRPCSQPNTKWVSEDNTISFYVDENCVSTGQIDIDGEIVDFYLTNDMGLGVHLFSLKVLDTNIETLEDEYEYWLCSFKSKKKFIATVKRTTYFHVGDKITFYKVNQ